MDPRQRRGPGGSTIRTVDLGTAELVPDPRRANAWTLLVDGVSQSYVDLDAPTHLEFDYLRLLATVVDAAAPRGRPLRVLHLGGGGLTLPRYVRATRPGSAQRVVDRDGALMSMVTELLPLPEAAGIDIQVGDARTFVQSSPDASYDVVVADVYRAAQMPRSVASTQFAHHVARLLRPEGLYGVNIADLPPLVFSRRQVATLSGAFGDVCVMAAPGMMRGKRFGNVVLAAAVRRDGLPLGRLVGRTGGRPAPRRLLHGEELDGFVAGARAMVDATARDSPVTLPLPARRPG